MSFWELIINIVYDIKWRFDKLYDLIEYEVCICYLYYIVYLIFVYINNVYINWKYRKCVFYILYYILLVIVLKLYYGYGRVNRFENILCNSIVYWFEGIIIF